VAIDIAKKYNSKIKIVTCLERDFRTPWYGRDFRVDEALLKKRKKVVEKNFLRLEERAKKSKVSIRSKIMVVQSIVKSLLSFATSNKVDLIIVGSHGRTGFDKLLLGSVANGISQKARCPVLIIK
jgi:nucleotide-binding universal stress UspA family protein